MQKLERESSRGCFGKRPGSLNTEGSFGKRPHSLRLLLLFLFMRAKCFVFPEKHFATITTNTTKCKNSSENRREAVSGSDRAHSPPRGVSGSDRTHFVCCCCSCSCAPSALFFQRTISRRLQLILQNAKTRARIVARLFREATGLTHHRGEFREATALTSFAAAVLVRARQVLCFSRETFRDDYN